MFPRLPLSALLIFSLLVAPLGPLAHAAESPAPGRTLVSRGLNQVRIVLFATDEEWPQIVAARHAAEHALEPPTDVEGFWARKLQTLIRPWFAIDLVRSFQNAARLTRESEEVKNVWLRNLLLSAITMFSITHGSEVVTGSTMAIYELVQLNFGAALAWAGLALPGLYDVGCWAGAGVLFFRPTRELFDVSRRFAFSLSGELAQRLGAKAVMRRLFSDQSAMEKLTAAAQRSNGRQTIEVDLADEQLLNVDIRNPAGNIFAKLKFEAHAGELILKTARLNESEMPGPRGTVTKWLPNVALRQQLRGLGWNVKGALLTLSRLMRTGNADLMAHEHTFVRKIEKDGSEWVLHFRHGVVAVPAGWAHTPEPCRDLLAGEAGSVRL